MGIENRDYVRDENPSGGSLPATEHPAVRLLIMITVAVFVAQIFITRPATEVDQPYYPQLEQLSESADTMTDEQQLKQLDQLRQQQEYFVRRASPKISLPEYWFKLDTSKVLKGQVWRLLTSAFCHDRMGMWHIIFNMLLLFWFGRELESIYGSRRFIWFYVTAAIFSSLAYVALQSIIGERIPAIGASGAVMAVMMVYAIFHPRREILVFFVLPVQIRFLVAIYVLYDLHPVLWQLSGTFAGTGIAHSAHLGGLLYGYVFWRTGLSLLSLWQRLPFSKPGESTRHRLTRTSEPEIWANSAQPATRPGNTDALDQKVDQILVKISESGKESLTDKELATLERASKKYGQRGGQDD